MLSPSRLVESAEEIDRAYAAASATPPRAAWATLLDRTLLVLGGLLAVAGVVFFFAFNWAKIGAFSKLGIIGAGIVASVCVAAWRTLARASGRMALVVASLLVGPLLAVYGQHYQTGADPYELFAGWLVLVTPWAFAASSTLLWGFLIVLADVAAGLFAEQMLEHTLPDPWRDRFSLLLFLGVHLVALVALEIGPRAEERSRRLLARIVALVGMALLSFGAGWYVVDRHDEAVPAVCAVGAPFAWGSMLYVYGRARRDLPMLAILGASVVAVVTTISGKLFHETLDSSGAKAFLTGLVLVGQVAALTFWLRHAARAHAAAALATPLEGG